MPYSQRILRLHACAATFALAGCAGFQPDGGVGEIQRDAAERLGHPVVLQSSPEADRRVGRLLLQPLSADAAVEIALLGNPTLRARFAELRMAEADRVQAGRLPNPTFAFGRLARGSELEIDRGLQFDLIRLLALPLASREESTRYAQARREAVLQVLALATRTRQAWVEAVAAQQQVAYRLQVLQSAEASAELARRMVAAGNWNRLSEARQLAYRSAADEDLARSREAQVMAREQLTRLLGMSAAQGGYTLPDRLPDLPAAPLDAAEVTRRATTERLDVEVARLDAQASAQRLGLTRATRLVDVLEVGAARNSYNDGTTERGYQIRLELPLFDWGESRTVRAEATYERSLQQAAATVLRAESELREAHARYLSRYASARRYRDEVVPLARRVSAETLLRYNAMLTGVFELLVDARAQVAAVDGALAAQRDFWLAQLDLDRALLGAPVQRTLP